MRNLLAVLCCLSVIVDVTGQSPILPALKVGTDNRSLVTSDNKAFFWLGDTGWELFHRLTKEEADLYLKTRSRQGFTVIQAVALAELDGIREANAEGQLPFSNLDSMTPNERYFQHIDWVINRAASYGLYIALLPTWGDKVSRQWGKGPEIFNETNAAAFGNWIGTRYRNTGNIIWVLGGDRNPRDENDVKVWRSLAMGINKGAGGKEKTLMTFHPQPGETSSSSPWFHKEPWLDFNMLQTGHCRDTDVWNKVTGDYLLNPVKPVLNGEAIYEDHPVCFDASKYGYSTPYDVRKAAYLSVFAGSFGFTYGCHAVWQFYTPPNMPVNAPLKVWKESLELEGANQMKHLRNLMTEYPIIGLIPDQSMITNPLESSDRIQAIRGKDFVLIYSASGKKIDLKTGKIPGKSFSGYWYDPRTGKKRVINAIPVKPDMEFIPPSDGAGNDWVLALRAKKSI